VWNRPDPPSPAAIGLPDGRTLLLFALSIGGFAWEIWRWRRERALDQSRQEARDMLLQRLSHELRTPAASVRALVDALDREEGMTPEDRAQFLALVRSEAERLGVGIDRLLQAARGDGQMRLDRIPLDLTEWAEGVHARWVARLPGLRLDVVGPCPAVADPDRLDEALDALLDNTRKYGGPNVRFSVRVRGQPPACTNGPLPRGAVARIEVEDDGEGVPAKDRARLLHRFERIEGRVNDPGGHGLGLWAANEVAHAHGGAITIEGRARFVLTLGSPE
jgi:signal transduction histidine kinase